MILPVIFCSQEIDDSNQGAVIAAILVAIAIAVACVYYVRQRKGRAKGTNSISPLEKSAMGHSTAHLSLPVAAADQFVIPPSSPSSQSIKLSPDTIVLPPPNAS